MELFIQDYKLGKLYFELSEKNKEKIFKFFPDQNHEKSFLMMGAFSGYTRVIHFPDEFSLYLQYNMSNGEVLKSLIPDWKCKKEKQKIHLNLPNFEPLI